MTGLLTETEKFTIPFLPGAVCACQRLIIKEIQKTRNNGYSSGYQW